MLTRLATLPILGGLLAIPGPDEAEGQGQRKRRKKAHKHGKGRRHKHSDRKKSCKAESVAQACAGKCGRVTNNCKTLVDCGACTCTPFTECPAAFCPQQFNSCGGICVLPC